MENGYEERNLTSRQSPYLENSDCCEEQLSSVSDIPEMGVLSFLLFLFFAILEAAFVIIYAVYYDGLSTSVFYLTVCMILIGGLVLWDKKSPLKLRNLMIFILYLLYSLFILHFSAVVGGNLSYSFEWFIAVYLVCYPIHMFVFKLYQLQKKIRPYIEVLFYLRMSAISFWVAYFAYLFCMLMMFGCCPEKNDLRWSLIAVPVITIEFGVIFLLWLVSVGWEKVIILKALIIHVLATLLFLGALGLLLLLMFNF
ncbi:hypothetical protein [Cysteiniphilum sp. 6C5]